MNFWPGNIEIVSCVLYKPNQSVILLPCPPTDLGQGNVLMHEPEIFFFFLFMDKIALKNKNIKCLDIFFSNTKSFSFLIFSSYPSQGTM